MKKSLILLFAMILFVQTSAQEIPKPATESSKAPASDDSGVVEAKSYRRMKLDVSKADAICFVVDQSPSMIDDIKEIVKHVDKMLSAVNVKEVPVSIVSYANNSVIVLKNSKDIIAIKKAFDGIGGVTASKECLFEAINTGYDILEKFKKPEFVVVTDETGDDDDKLEKVLKRIKKKARVHIISTPATFGNKEWHWSILVDPAKGKTDHFISNNGPASGTPEILCDFFFAQRSFYTDEMAPFNWKNWAVDAGWAAFSLSYISEMTKGKVYLIPTDTYILKNEDFDARLKKQYKPQLVEKKLLPRFIKKDLRRKAVHKGLLAYYKDRMKMHRGLNLGAVTIPVADKQKAILTFLKTNGGAIKKNMNLIQALIKTLEGGLSNFSKRSSSKSYLSKNIPEHKRWQANIELDFALAFCAWYEMHMYNQFIVDVAAGKVDVRTVGSADNPKGFKKVPLDNVVRVEILMVPAGVKDDEKVKESYIDHSEKCKIIGAMLKIRGKKKLKDLSVAEIGKIAHRCFKIVEENHAKTPWAVTAKKAREHMGPYAFLAYIPGNSSNVKKTQ